MFSRFFFCLSICLLFCLPFSLLTGCAPNTEIVQNQNLAEIDAELMVLDLQNHAPEAAKLHLQQAQALAPNDPQVLAASGYFAAKMADPIRAQASYTAAIKAAPEDPEIENEYGVFLYQSGAYAAALPYFIKAAADPENVTAGDASKNAGLTEMKLNNPSAAQEYFVRAFAEDPDLLESAS